MRLSNGDHMNEDAFNQEVRKFLKRFGITAQREIERSVVAALESGAIRTDAVLQVQATLTIPGVLPKLQIEGDIGLA